MFPEKEIHTRDIIPLRAVTVMMNGGVGRYENLAHTPPHG